MSKKRKRVKIIIERSEGGWYEVYVGGIVKRKVFVAETSASLIKKLEALLKKIES